MRQTYSHHRESLHAPPCQLWDANPFRQPLNIQRFVKLLEHVGIAGTSSSGKKRASPSSFSSDQGASKRIKLSSSSSFHSEGGLDDILQDARVDHPSITHPSQVEDTELLESVPVLCHVSEIQYTLSHPEERNDADHDAETLGLVRQEQKLIDALEGFFGATHKPQTIDFGQLHFAEHHDRLVAIAHRLDKEVAESEMKPDHWLLLVPNFDHEIDIHSLDLGLHCQDLLADCPLTF